MAWVMGQQMIEKMFRPQPGRSRAEFGAKRTEAFADPRPTTSDRPAGRLALERLPILVARVSIPKLSCVDDPREFVLVRGSGILQVCTNRRRELLYFRLG